MTDRNQHRSDQYVACDCARYANSLIWHLGSGNQLLQLLGFHLGSSLVVSSWPEMSGQERRCTGRGDSRPHLGTDKPLKKVVGERDD